MANKQNSALWYGSKIKEISNTESYRIEPDQKYKLIFFENCSLEFDSNDLVLENVHGFDIERDENGNFKSLDLSVKKVDLHYDKNKLVSRGNVHRIGPYGIQFKKPAKLTIPYECEDSFADSLQVYCYDPDLGEWEITRKIGIDKENNTLTVEVYHFSDYVPGAGSYKIDESGTFTNLPSSGTVDENLGAVTFSRTDASIATPGVPLALSSKFNSDYCYSTILTPITQEMIGASLDTGGISGKASVPDPTQNFYRLSDGWTFEMPYAIYGPSQKNTFRVAMAQGSQYILKSIIGDAYFGYGTKENPWTVEGYEFWYEDEVVENVYIPYTSVGSLPSILSENELTTKNINAAVGDTLRVVNLDNKMYRCVTAGSKSLSSGWALVAEPPYAWKSYARLHATIIGENATIHCTVKKEYKTNYYEYTVLNTACTISNYYKKNDDGSYSLSGESKTFDKMLVNTSSGQSLYFNASGTIDEIWDVTGKNHIKYTFSTDILTTTVDSNDSGSDSEFTLADITNVIVGDSIVIKGQCKTIKSITPTTGTKGLVSVYGEFDLVPVAGDAVQIGTAVLQNIASNDGRYIKFDRSDTTAYVTLSLDATPNKLVSGDTILGKYTFNGESRNSRLTKYEVVEYTVPAASTITNLFTLSPVSLQYVNYVYDLTDQNTSVKEDSIVVTTNTGAEIKYKINMSCFKSVEYIDTSDASFARCMTLDGSGTVDPTTGQLFLNITKPLIGTKTITLDSSNVGNSMSVGGQHCQIMSVKDMTSFYSVGVYGYTRDADHYQVKAGMLCTIDIYSGNINCNTSTNSNVATISVPTSNGKSILDDFADINGSYINVHMRSGYSNYYNTAISTIANYNKTLHRLTTSSPLVGTGNPPPVYDFLPYQYMIQSSSYGWSVRGRIQDGSDYKSINIPSKILDVNSVTCWVLFEPRRTGPNFKSIKKKIYAARNINNRWVLEFPEDDPLILNESATNYTMKIYSKAGPAPYYALDDEDLIYSGTVDTSRETVNFTEFQNLSYFADLTNNTADVATKYSKLIFGATKIAAVGAAAASLIGIPAAAIEGIDIGEDAAIDAINLTRRACLAIIDDLGTTAEAKLEGLNKYTKLIPENRNCVSREYNYKVMAGDGTLHFKDGEWRGYTIVVDSFGKYIGNRHSLYAAGIISADPEVLFNEGEVTRQIRERGYYEIKLYYPISNVVDVNLDENALDIQRLMLNYMTNNTAVSWNSIISAAARGAAESLPEVKIIADTMDALAADGRDPALILSITKRTGGGYDYKIGSTPVTDPFKIRFLDYFVGRNTTEYTTVSGQPYVKYQTYVDTPENPDPYLDGACEIKYRTVITPPVVLNTSSKATSESDTMTSGDTVSIEGGTAEIIGEQDNVSLGTKTLLLSTPINYQNHDINPNKYWYEIYKAGKHFVYYINKPKVTSVEQKKNASQTSNYTATTYNYQYNFGRSVFTQADKINGIPTLLDFSELDGLKFDIRSKYTEVTSVLAMTSSSTEYMMKTTFFSYDGMDKNQLSGADSVIVQKKCEQGWYNVSKSKVQNERVNVCVPGLFKPVRVTGYVGNGNNIDTDWTYTSVVDNQYDSYGRTIKTTKSAITLQGTKTYDEFVQYAGKPIDMIELAEEFSDNPYASLTQNGAVFDQTMAFNFITARSVRSTDTGASNPKAHKTYTLYSAADDVNSKKSMNQVAKISLVEQTSLTQEELDALNETSYTDLTRVSETEYLYDTTKGLLTGIKFADGKTIEIGYENVGSFKDWMIVKDVISLASNIDNGTQYVINTFDYDIRGRMVSKTTKLASDVSGTLYDETNFPTTAFAYTYDAMNRMLTKSNVNGKIMIHNKFDDTNRVSITTSSNGFRVKKEYDEFYRLWKTSSFKPNFKLTTGIGVYIPGDETTMAYSSSKEVLVNASMNEYHEYHGKVQRTFNYLDPAQVWTTTPGTGKIINEVSYDSIGRPVQNVIVGTNGERRLTSQIVYHDVENATTTRTIVDHNSSDGKYKWNESYVKNDWMGFGPVKSTTYDEVLCGVLGLFDIGGVDNIPQAKAPNMGTGQSLTPRETLVIYNGHGQPEQRVMPNGEVFYFQYSTAGKLEKMIYPGLSSKSWVSVNTNEISVVNTYDINGNVHKTKDKNNSISTIEYNNSNMPVKATTVGDAGVIVVETKYSHLGVHSVSKSDGTTVETASKVSEYKDTYDAVGIIGSSSQTVYLNGTMKTNKLTYSYDMAGNLIGQTLTGSDAGSDTYSKKLWIDSNYLPTTLAQSISAVIEDDNGVPKSTPIVTVYTNFGMTTNKFVYGDGSSKEVGYTYDEFLRLAGITFPAGIENDTFSRDYVGNITTKNGKTFTYDGFGRMSHDGNANVDLTFDALGNILTMGSKSYIYESNNAVIGSPNTMRLKNFIDSANNINWTYNYDDAGNITRVYTQSTNIIPGTSTQRGYEIDRFNKLSYNSANQLSSMFYKNIISGIYCFDKYFYNHLGLRVLKQEFENFAQDVTSNVVVANNQNRNNDGSVVMGAIVDNTLSGFARMQKVRIGSSLTNSDISYDSDLSKYVLKESTITLYSGNDILYQEKFNSAGSIIETKHNVIVGGKVLACFVRK